MFGLLFVGCSPAPPPAEPVAAPCETCHAEVAAAWAGSHHALAERDLTPKDAWASAVGATRIVGVHPLEQAIVPHAGRDQVFDPARDVRDGSRFSIFDTPREPGEWGHHEGAGMIWNARCAACHNTNVRKGLQPDGSYQTVMTAMGVTCAACHGDQQTHAAGGPARANDRMLDTCLACHTRRAELVDGFTPGQAYLDHFTPLTVAHSDFRADGRALGEVFEGNQFLASGMYAAGVRCGDCHDPHSGALRADGDALCARCHDALPVDDHPDHPAGTGCVECHMPTITVMGRHARRDHGFTSPTEGLLPDPCAACHAEHPADRPTDPTILQFASVREGAPFEADTALGNPGRQSAWLELLGGRPASMEIVRSQVEHSDPWIRTAAVNALVPMERADLRRLEQAAEDPLRSVRVAAQRSLARAGKPLATLPDVTAYYTHNSDEPSARSERGILRVQAGDAGGLDDLFEAVRLDPSSAEWGIRLATGLAIVGRSADAIGVLRTHPAQEDGALQLALGLALAPVDREQALEVLAAVVEDDPRQGKAWRNLAILHEQQGDRTKAIAALDRALQLQPNDPELTAWRARLR